MAKIKEELLNVVKEAQKNMQSIQIELGNIALLEIRKEALIEAYKEQQKKIQETTNTIRSEYGDGSIDLETGEFTPDTSAEVVE